MLARQTPAATASATSFKCLHCLPAANRAFRCGMARMPSTPKDLKLATIAPESKQACLQAADSRLVVNQEPNCAPSTPILRPISTYDRGAA